VTQWAVLDVNHALERFFVAAPGPTSAACADSLLSASDAAEDDVEAWHMADGRAGASPGACRGLPRMSGMAPRVGGLRS